MSEPNTEKVIYQNAFFAELEAEQKANHPNIPASDIAIGYHNGLTMAKAIAIKLATPAPWMTPHARWEFVNDYESRCTNCGENSWIDHNKEHRFCPNCGAKMNLK